MGYSYLAFGAGNTSGMNVGCNLNDLFAYACVLRLCNGGVCVRFVS